MLTLVPPSRWVIPFVGASGDHQSNDIGSKRRQHGDTWWVPKYWRWQNSIIQMGWGRWTRGNPGNLRATTKLILMERMLFENSTFFPLFKNRIHDLLMTCFFSHNLPGYNWRQKHVKAGSPDSRELSLQADSDWLWRGGKFYNRRRQSQ